MPCFRCTLLSNDDAKHMIVLDKRKKNNNKKAKEFNGMIKQIRSTAAEQQTKQAKSYLIFIVQFIICLFVCMRIIIIIIINIYNTQTNKQTNEECE